MNITLAGALGSGKSSVGRLLAARLGIEFISTGQIFRKIGEVSDMEVLQTNLAAENNSDIDAQVDSFIMARAEEDRPFVMDSRMAWHFVPNSLRVYLDVSEETAASRVYGDRSRSSEEYKSISEAKMKLVERRQSEITRYRRLYNVDIDNRENYDVVILTDSLAPGQIADIIEKVIERNDKGYWIAKSRVVPMESSRSLSGFSLSDVVPESQLVPLPGHIEHGFLFVHSEPLLLASWLRSGGTALKFTPTKPTFLAPGAKVTSDAKSFSAAHFYDWEEAGGVELEFVPFAFTSAGKAPIN